MKAIEKYTDNRFFQVLNSFPNTHLYIVGGLLLGLAAISIGADGQQTEKSQVLASGRLHSTIEVPKPNQESLDLQSGKPVTSETLAGTEINLERSSGMSTTSQPRAGASLTKTESKNNEAKNNQANKLIAASNKQMLLRENPVKGAFSFGPTTRLEVKSGDSLAKLFIKAGLKEKDIQKLFKDSPEAKKLTKIKPGQIFDFYISDNKLDKLIHVESRLHSNEYALDSTGRFVSQKIEVKPSIKRSYSSGVIEQSLYLSGTKAKLDDKLIMELASIFGWDIDFALDIRKGDQFSLLFEEKYIDSEKLGNGDILAAEFINQGKTFRAVRYVNKDGNSGYFTPTGQNMRKAFLRAPLDFRRISSNFNPRRLHPISKMVRPHRGTDYAAARGTPVWSSGNGKVIASAYDKANGNYIVIQHGNNIQTKYLHLHKRYVKKGARVKQKQVIGTVGTTGYSTGPHLHYEFLLDGVHRNPRTIVQKLPKAKSIPKDEIDRFNAQTQALVSALDNRNSETKFATLESKTKSL